MATELDYKDRSINPDPVTGEHGSHPVGTAVGAGGGALAGAAVGAAVAGPVGAIVGGVIGTVAGGAAGHGVAEGVNPTVEDAYWKDNYAGRDYVDRTLPYSEYQPAYRYGWEARSRYAGQPYETVEGDLERGWDKAKGESHLAWNQAKNATRDAWHRVERAIPGDADGDGR
jgi:hypothetical protein